MSIPRTIVPFVCVFLASSMNGQGGVKTAGVKQRLTATEYLRDSLPYGVDSCWIFYDPQGRETVVRRKHIDRTISIDSSWYDDTGLLVRKASLNYKEPNPNRRFAGVYTYQYDPQGRLQRELVTTTEDPNGQYGTTTTTYTYSDSTLSTRMVVDATGAVRGRTEYGYDGLGNIAWEKGFRDGSTTPETWRAFEYDSTGQRTAEAILGSNGQLLHKWAIEYTTDSKGRVQFELQRFADGRVRMTTGSTYNPNGNVVQEVIRFQREAHIVTYRYEYYQ